MESMMGRTTFCDCMRYSVCDLYTNNKNLLLIKEILDYKELILWKKLYVTSGCELTVQE